MPRAVKPKPDAPTGPRLVGKSTRTAPPTPIVVSQDLIAIRAYELFQQEGGVHGNHLDHWLRAEKELLESQRPQPVKKAAGGRAKI